MYRFNISQSHYKLKENPDCLKCRRLQLCTFVTSSSFPPHVEMHYRNYVEDIVSRRIH